MKQTPIFRAFVAVDVMFGIIIVTSVTIGLVTFVSREHQAERQFASSRGAVHLAEYVLLDLQHHQAVPVATEGQRFTIQPAGAAAAPAGYVWAKVDADAAGQHQSLFGVVPAAALTGGLTNGKHS